MTPRDQKEFFEFTLPGIIRMALSLPEMCTKVMRWFLVISWEQSVVTTHVWYMYRRNFLTEFNMCIFSVSAIIEKANRTDYNDDTTAGTSYRALIFKFKVIFILQYMFSTNSHLFYFIIQVACLLSCAFLCMFPRRKGQRNKNDEYNHFPTINFNR